MPQTKTRSAKKKTKKPGTNTEHQVADVMTLADAAAYLRVPEAEVVRMVHEQGLAGRKIGEDWRFLKSALQEWLRCLPNTREAVLSQIGAFKDDPYLDEMLKEIYERRGRPMTEEG